MTLFLLVLLAGNLLAASTVPLHVADARGKKPSGVTVEAGRADSDGWRELRVSKSKTDYLLVWPWDGAVQQPDGPGEVPVIVIPRGDPKSLENPRAVAAMATPVVLGSRSVAEEAMATGLSAQALAQAFQRLIQAEDSFAKGVGLLYAGRNSQAADELGKALRERQRQLTRVPSEIFALAMLHGGALMAAGQFDKASVAYLTALTLRPSEEKARLARAAALLQAGKKEAAAPYAR